MEQLHGTTILSVRRGAAVALGGDGQVTLGNVVVKGGAKKVRRLYQDRILAGFAGGTADAFTLFERFEAKLDKHQGNLMRSAVELAKDPHGSEHMKELLVGQILWTTWSGLLPLAAISAGVLAAWHGLRLKASPLGFYLLFAVAITASVQVVGVYLVFASLIVPALAARCRWRLGYGVGAIGYIAGLLASALLDLPSGAAIVLSLVLAAFVVLLTTRQRARHAA